ncbi:hypothetical protein LCGC14_1578580 [marine sediment metagenome]|uniref:Uncharacterized protein n=1 Tax=marine sediment metagenome TaxID=412755 RepID=A0A0F9J3N5_9ZZZZ
MAPPIKYNIDKLLGSLKFYTEGNDIPILAEFAYKYGISREYLYQLAGKNKSLSYAIKKLILKKEAQLEKLGLSGHVDKTMAIFSLKQIGWKDRVDIDTTTKGEKIGTFDAPAIARDLYALIYGPQKTDEGDGGPEKKKGNRKAR